MFSSIFSCAHVQYEIIGVYRHAFCIHRSKSDWRPNGGNLESITIEQAAEVVPEAPVMAHLQVPEVDLQQRVEERRCIGVDLFAGAGGFSLGALLAGLDIVAAVESSTHACSTYRNNLIASKRTKTALFENDILELTPDDLMRQIGITPGECDVLIGGPPCQGFSAHRLNNSGVDDPRNKLLLRYFEYVEALRPKFFLVENVPGMLWERHASYVEAFYSLANQAGYDLAPPFVLNAKDYGVPQNRKRVFLLGRDRELFPTAICDWPPPATHGSPQKIAAGEDLQPWVNAEAVFVAPAPLNDPNDIHMNHGAEMVNLFINTPANGGSRFESGRELPCHQSHDGHSDVYGRINPDIPGPTMTTACINPSKGRFVHPTEHHGITLRQAARFQTFPEWWIFEGGLMSAGTQIGNAVPVHMAEQLLTPLVAALIAMQQAEAQTEA